MLRKDQVRQHLEMLDAKSQTRRYLVLLTPDDSRSSYIQGFRAIDHRIRHLEWRHAYDLLESPWDADIFSALAHQFQAHIQKTIFKQDLAGGILKISFGKKSGLDAKTYLGEMPNWNRAGTPPDSTRTWMERAVSSCFTTTRAKD
jgi:hypothetical protein